MLVPASVSAHRTKVQTTVKTTNREESTMPEQEQERTREVQPPTESTDVFEQEGGDAGEEGQQEEGRQEAGEEGKEGVQEDDGHDERLTRFTERQRQLEFENAYLKQRLAESTPSQPSKEQTEDDDELDEPDEKFIERLRTNPAQTLKERDRKLEQRVLKRVQQSLQDNNTAQSGLARDREIAIQQYPELTSNQALRERATQIYNALIQNRGGQPMPGDLTLAAGFAYGELAKAGKLNSTGTNSTDRREVARRATQDPLVRNRTSAPPSGNGKDPLHGFSPSDRKAAESAAKALGVSLTDWRKAYDEMKESDPSYGR